MGPVQRLECEEPISNLTPEDQDAQRVAVVHMFLERPILMPRSKLRIIPPQ